MIAISTDPVEDSAAFVADAGLTALTLASDLDLAVIDAYGVRHAGKDIAVPAVFLLAPDGRVAYAYVGESMSDRPDSARMLALIDGL